ncbi:Arm DNA-binding domain-containing protein [Planktomarina temperata]|nr:Arm DNA-binding domain-containing protein [Planktomarina temperata]
MIFVGVKMGVRNLTEKFCNSVTEVGKHPDNRRQGLFLMVQKTGSKNWGQILHVKNSGEKPELGLGGFPTISLAEARKIASENHALARRGINPKKSRAVQQTIPNFAELAEEVIQSKCSGWTNEKSEKQWRSALKMYAFPVIGRLPVSEITSRHIATVLNPIWTKLEQPHLTGPC